MFRVAFVFFVILLSATAEGQVVESFTEPYRKVDLTTSEVGLLARVYVREGDGVKKDQLLAALDSEVQQLAVEIAQANLAARGRLESALAERDLRKDRLSKLESLRKTGHATQDELERARADTAVAEANVLIAMEQRKVDELDYRRLLAIRERRNLRSPIDGTVVRVYREDADLVGGANAPVLTVMQLDPLRVSFSVPAARAAAFRAGDKRKVFFPETDEAAVAQVDFVSPVVDADSGTVRIKVLIPNPEGKYRSGSRCTLDLDGTPLGRSTAP
jgi:RND family efflux transporter MFP subunit